LLNLGAQKLCRFQDFPCLPEHRLSDLNNGQTHEQILPEIPPDKIFNSPLLFAWVGTRLVAP